MAAQEIMSGRSCYRCGKKSQKGNWVSHANNKNIRRQQPNLKMVKIWQESLYKKVRLCMKCLRVEGEKIKKLQLSQKTEKLLRTSRQAQKEVTYG